jgi:SpoVK/Ycf46/Vps4 family AAA+-type ATPase
MEENEECEEKLKFTPSPIYPYPVRRDIVGQAGQFVDDFILGMNSYAVFKKMGVMPDKTFLISGKPGNGKSMGIDALINEVNKDFYTSSLKGGDVDPKLIGMKYDIGKYGTAYINMGSKIAQGFFNECFKIARVCDVLIIFDEAENLFGKRQDNGNHKEDSKLLDTIMMNMQRVHDTPYIYSVMMSNFPEAFDSASVRAGRIDKRYEFKSPTEEERIIGYNHAIDEINTRAGYQVVRCFDTERLSSMSKDYSYADIVESVNSAVKKRAVEIARTRKPGIVNAGYVSQSRLEKSILEHKSNFHSKEKRIGF